MGALFITSMPGPVEADGRLDTDHLPGDIVLETPNLINSTGVSWCCELTAMLKLGS